MGLATDYEWEGSYSNVEIDGVDIWGAILSNSSSPHQEIVFQVDGRINLF